MTRFFITRPIFASVLSIVIVLAGLASAFSLPIAQYPQIAPPTVIITATYPGASAETLSKTVPAPIEEELTGVEGYTESAASGILAGINLDRVLRNEEPIVPPSSTMLGGLFKYLREAPPSAFQPMNSNFGLLDPLQEYVRDKGLRREKTIARARADFENWISNHELRLAPAESQSVD